MADARFLTQVKFTVMDSNGDPLSGGKVYLFETGTATPKTSWTTPDKSTPNAHPVVLDSNGQADICIDSTGGQYRLRVDDSDDVTVYGPIDNVDGMAVANVGGDTIYLTEHNADGTHGGAFIWKKGADVTSAATLTLGTDGNYFDILGANTITAIATLGIGTVIKLHFDAALTLTHNATDLVLPGGVNIITRAGDEYEFIEYASGDWRLIGGNNRSVNGVVKWLKGADVISGAALPLISDGNYFDVTGVVTITSMNSLGVGTTVKLHFDGALQITHDGDNIILPAGVNITTVAGDELEFTEHAAGKWRMTGGNAANLAVTSLVVSGPVTVSGAAASPPVANVLYKDNVVKAWIRFNGTGTIAIDDSFNVSSITDQGTGRYLVTWDTDFADANYAWVVSSFLDNDSTLSNAGIHDLAVGSAGVDTWGHAGAAAIDINLITGVAMGNQ